MVSVVVTVVMVLVSIVVAVPEVAVTVVELCDEEGEAGILALLGSELDALEGRLLLLVDELVDEEAWTLDRPALLLAGGLAEDENVFIVLMIKSEFNEAGVDLELPVRGDALGLETEDGVKVLVLPEIMDVGVELGGEIEGTVTVVGELVLAAMGATNVGFRALVCCTRSTQTLPAIAPTTTGMQSGEGMVSNPAYSSPPQS